MLARLTMGTARLLDVCFDTSGLVECQSEQQSEDPDSSLVLDLYALRCFITPIPDNAWHRMASACGRTVAPVYTNLLRTLNNDFNNVAQIMLDLEVCYGSKVVSRENSSSASPPRLEGTQITTEQKSDPGIVDTSCGRRPAKRRRSADRPVLHPLVISSSNPCVPSIVITPAPTQLRDISCCVPYQDQAFGNLLTVPCHPAFNQVHPPMVPSEDSLPYLNRWKWENGRWKAIVPNLSEQTRRGIFSKPTSISRRKSKHPKYCV